ncbi:brachyury proteinA-like [Scleropages formosus]|uniref:Brachyury proteinA-like n=1 Tax=Scleropages formosus TaxID=113540 RepID=A0A0P7YBW1_SCLFO|nr:T-box transcription factor T-A-like [Scleropages formosus]KPP63683.1 brachyury proteinA-like [Scleropages formosus]
MTASSADQCIEHLLSAVESELQKGSEKGDASERDIRVALEDGELWAKFKELTNEMIVTKTGRRMFPVLRVGVSGLDPNAMYTVLLDFVAADANRWKYVNGEWVPGGKPEPQSPSCVYIHPDSPNFGAHWMKTPVSFSKVKLSNKLNGGGQIMLNSLHKYEPRIHIVKVGGIQKMITSRSFPETQFIAVTAYQNEEITALKIKHNPFAKAFLDAKERSDHKDAAEHGGDGQQPGYAQLGGWFLSGNNPICPSSSPGQFSGSPLPSGSYCDRYPGLRAHRASPYPSHYSHRSANTNNYMDNSSPGLGSHDGWPALQVPSSAGMGALPHSAGAASNPSQYAGLWPVTGTSLNPSGSPTGGLTSQFLRSPSVSYSGLAASSLPASSPSPMYDASLAEVGGGDAQFENSIARLAASWSTPVAQSY